jgi:putative transposase
MSGMVAHGGRRAQQVLSGDLRAGAVRLVREAGKPAGAVARDLNLTGSTRAQRNRQLRALEAAPARRCPIRGLLHHSSPGSPYAGADCQAGLEALGITCSMSRRGNCHGNAPVQGFFSTVMSAMGDQFNSCGTANMELFDDIEAFITGQRRHSTVSQVSPAAFEKARATRVA